MRPGVFAHLPEKSDQPLNGGIASFQPTGAELVDDVSFSAARGKGAVKHPEEGGLNEGVGVQYGGRFRCYDNESCQRCEEKVHRVVIGPGSQIEKHKVCNQIRELANNLLFLEEGQIRGAGQQRITRDKKEPREGGFHQERLQGFGLLVDVIADTEVCILHAQTGVEIRRAEVEVHQDDGLPGTGQQHTEVCRENGLADAAFAARYRDHRCHKQLIVDDGRAIFKIDTLWSLR